MFRIPPLSTVGQDVRLSRLDLLIDDARERTLIAAIDTMLHDAKSELLALAITCLFFLLAFYLKKLIVNEIIEIMRAAIDTPIVI